MRCRGAPPVSLIWRGADGGGAGHQCSRSRPRRRSHPRRSCRVGRGGGGGGGWPLAPQAPSWCSAGRSSTSARDVTRLVALVRGAIGAFDAAHPSQPEADLRQLWPAPTVAAHLSHWFDNRGGRVRRRRRSGAYASGRAEGHASADAPPELSALGLAESMSCGGGWARQGPPAATRPEGVGRRCALVALRWRRGSRDAGRTGRRMVGAQLRAL